MDTVPMWMKNLDDEDMIFIKRFLLASGSLKEIAKELLKIKMPIEQIIQITKLPKEEIEKYK